MTLPRHGKCGAVARRFLAGASTLALGVALSAPAHAEGAEPVTSSPLAQNDSAVPQPNSSNANPAKASANRPGSNWLRKDAAPAKAKGTSDSVSVLRFTLFGVALFGLSMYALYRHQRGRLGRGPAAQRSALTLEGAVRVGPRAQVVVVNVAGRKLLLGVTESEVSRLAWLDDGMEPDAESEPERAEAAAPRAFATLDPRPQPAFETRRLAAPAPAPEPAPARPPTAASAGNGGAGRNAAPKRFRDALLGALGHKTTDAPESAAVAIAEATQDVVTRARAAPIAAPPGAPDMVDVEGQARGLVMRLQKRA